MDKNRPCTDDAMEMLDRVYAKKLRDRRERRKTVIGNISIAAVKNPPDPLCRIKKTPGRRKGQRGRCAKCGEEGHYEPRCPQQESE